jgi:hypothetical protein
MDELGGGKRPRVLVTINGHTWSTRVATVRGRSLIGLSHANRRAANVVTGDVAEVHVEVDHDERLVVEPPDVTAALDAVPTARRAFDRLTQSQQRQHLRVIDAAVQPATRARRIERAVSALSGAGPG